MKQAILSIPFILIIFFNSISVNGQDPLNRSFVDSTVIKLSEIMLDYYILKDKGKEASEILKNNLKQKKYYSFNGGELANELVKDLHAITNDKHLMIKFYPEGNAEVDYLFEETNKDKDYEPNKNALKRSRRNNYGFKEVSVSNLNIGYLKFNGFYDIRNSETTKTTAAAMEFLSHTNGLILDLTDNTGGDPNTLQFLFSYFFAVEPPTHYNTFHFRDGSDNYIEKYTLPYTPGSRLSNVPLFVIIGENTFSAGEALAYALKALKRATIIGNVSGGGAHAADFKLINKYFDMSIPLARAINPITNTNWEGVGVIPDVEIDLNKAKEYAQAELIKTALKNENDESLISAYEWRLEELEAILTEFQYNEKDLKKFIGDFEGDRKVFIENGILKYQRGEGEIATLTPLKEHSFKANTFSNVRIKFIFKKDTLKEMKFYLESGQYYLAKKIDE